nr:hypothetical protein Iba_chr15bCG7260 [Ipomoea batatas]
MRVKTETAVLGRHRLRPQGPVEKERVNTTESLWARDKIVDGWGKDLLMESKQDFVEAIEGSANEVTFMKDKCVFAAERVTWEVSPVRAGLGRGMPLSAAGGSGIA